MQRNFVLGGKARLRRSRKITQAVCEFLEQRTLFSTYIVTTNTDDNGLVAPTSAGNGVFNAVTLRDAITAANSSGVSNSISFSPNVFSTQQTITLTNGQFELSNAGNTTTITGPGADLLTIDGNGLSRVLQVDSGVIATISGITVTGGNSTGQSTTVGGGILNQGTLALTNSTISGNTTPSLGSAVYSSDVMTFNYCTVTGNTGSYSVLNTGALMVSINSSFTANTSGIDNSGSLTLVNSTVSNNQGGPALFNQAFLSIDASTISGNSGTGISNNGANLPVELLMADSTISNNDGVGVDNSSATNADIVDVTDCTISGNTGGGFANGVTGNVNAISGIYGTIISGNTVSNAADDLDGAVVTGNHNLIGVDNSGSFTNGVAGNLVGVNPMLGALANNGGPTQTQALLAGSPAINAGATFGADQGVDQRGIARPQGATADIGAFEFQNSTTTSLSDSAASVTVGKPVTFTATVTSTGGSPTGSVTFLDGATTLGTVAVNSSTHLATLASSSLSAGGHSVNAVYAGANDFLPSSSNTVTETITLLPTTTALTSSATSTTFGKAVTLTATVTSTAGTPTGTVTFLSGTTTLGTQTINTSTHKAIYVTTALPSGADNVTAVYAAANGFSASTSAATHVTVAALATTTKLTASPTSSSFGSNVNLTATVTATGASPTGTVIFKLGTATLGTANINTASHTAVLSTTALPVGTSSITAVYSGANGFTTSTSTALSEKVTGTVTTTKLVASPTSATAGASVLLTATVKATVGSPSGSITFLDGTKTLGTATINSSTGIATLTTTQLAVGSHTLSASYAGGGAFAGSVSTSVTETITPPATTTTINVSSNPGNIKQTLTFTATVTSANGSPSGSVSFVDGTKTLGTATINTSTHQATFSTTTLALGSHSVKAVYAGATAFAASSSAAISEQILPPASSTSLATSTNAANFGQPITLTATVSATGGSPTGSVTFLDGSTTLGTSSVSTSNHKATLIVSNLVAGSHNVTATYLGSTAFAPSTSSQITESITLPTIAVTADANPQIVGQTVTFTATVTGNSGQPGGNVTFLDGSTTLGVVSLNTNTQQAILSTASLGSGSHSITAVCGLTNASITSPVFSETISPPSSTSTTLAASSPTTDLGQQVALTATVTSGGGNPTGTVTFLDSGETIGTANVNSSNGQAVLDISNFTLGGHDLTAVYDGATSFITSTSNDVAETITLDATTTALSVSNSSPEVGQTVTFTATVTSPDGNPTTGSVTFLDGTETIGTVNVNASTGKAVFATAGLDSELHQITAVYTGTNVYATSTSSESDVTVLPPLATTTVLSGPSATDLNQFVTLTATVTASRLSPDGTVTFLDSGQTIGTAVINTSTHQAVLTVNTLSIGGHDLTAVYDGDTTFVTSTSNDLSETINLDPTTSKIAVSTEQSIFGQNVTFTATVTSADGSPDGTVTFLGDDNTTIGMATVNSGTGKAILSLTDLSAGDYEVTAVYSGSDVFATSSSSGQAEVTVLPAQATTVVLTAAQQSVDLGQNVNLTATVTAPNGAPDGIVTFLDGTETLGTATINTSTHKAILSASFNAVGDHDLTATYSGDASFLGYTCTDIHETVTLDATTTTLSESPAPLLVGDPVTFTATVTSPDGSPDGSVTFLDGAETLGVVTVNSSTNQAALTTSNLALGDHPMIEAVYSGTDIYAAGMSSFVDANIVSQVPTTTTLTVSSATSQFDQPITFTATVTATSGSPDGMVALVDGTSTLATATLNTNTNQASFTFSGLTVGSHNLVAVYAGDTTFAGSQSSAPTGETVTTDVTHTSIASSGSPAQSGTPVTFTATLSSTYGTPGGTVTFLDGSTTIGTANVNSNTHQATLTYSQLSVGSHTIHAHYNGDNTDGTSSSALSQTINTINSSTTTLAVSANPAGLNSTVILTATVTSLVGSPSGTVTFYDGTTILGTFSVNTTTNKATLPVIFSSVGTHSLTAVYAGDTTHNGSTSAAVSEVVNLPATTTALTLSSSSVALGKNELLTATVTPSAGGHPTGSVIFMAGNTTLGTATVNSSGVATLSEYNLYTGQYSLSAIYSGDNTFTGSTGTNSLSITAPQLSTQQDGLQFGIATQGTGVSVSAGQYVEVDYTGYIHDPGQPDDGTKFDSSLNAGRTPFEFGLGDTDPDQGYQTVIQGWEEGIPGMAIGETRVLVIPPSLAYGSSGSGSIPGNATLTFIVRMLAIIPRLQVVGANNTVQINMNDPASIAAGTNFGSVAVNSTSAASSFAFYDSDANTSSGKGYLFPVNGTLTGLVLTGNITITGANASDFILTSISGGISITFKPSAKGVRNAVVNIPTNDPGVPNFTFNIQGTGA